MARNRRTVVVEDAVDAPADEVVYGTYGESSSDEVESDEVPASEPEDNESNDVADVEPEAPTSPNLTTMSSIFTQPVQQAAPAVVEEEPVVVQRTTKKARVNNTWSLYYGGVRYDFVAGQTYEVPAEIHAYLLNSGNLLPLDNRY